MDRQSQRLNVGLRERSNSVDHWSNRLNNKGRRDQSCHTSHRSRGLDRDHRVCSGQTDHQSNRPSSNPGEQYGQADYRSPGPDKGSKCYSGVSAHRSTRPDNSSGGQLGPQDQQNSMKIDEKFSSHRGLNREISTDSQTSDQDCDRDKLLKGHFCEMNFFEKKKDKKGRFRILLFVTKLDEIKESSVWVLGIVSRASIENPTKQIFFWRFHLNKSCFLVSRASSLVMRVSQSLFLNKFKRLCSF